jgi:hypothetical protein
VPWRQPCGSVRECRSSIATITRISSLINEKDVAASLSFTTRRCHGRYQQQYNVSNHAGAKLEVDEAAKASVKVIATDEAAVTKAEKAQDTKKGATVNVTA